MEKALVVEMDGSPVAENTEGLRKVEEKPYVEADFIMNSIKEGLQSSVDVLPCFSSGTPI